MANEPVLLVDPDPAFLRCIQRVFDAADLDLDTASTGEEALIMLTSTPYGVVVSATDLTDMTPQRFFGRVCKLRPDCEAIALVTPHDPELAADLYDHGNLFNHLWKPIDEVSDLTRQVGRAFERRALKRHNAYLLTELRNTREELHLQTDFLVQVERLAALGHGLRDLAEEIAAPIGELEAAVSQLDHALSVSAAASRARLSADDVPLLVDRIRTAAQTCLDRIQSVHAFCDDRSGEAPCARTRGLLQDAMASLRTIAMARGLELPPGDTASPPRATTSPAAAERRGAEHAVYAAA